jgi:cyclomaltodextrinase / maltogenic alpha-amylase / neopullulanase
MPQLNLADSQAREWMLDIARFWLREFDVDGFRLDHAQGPGPSFWSDFWAACRQEKPESFCFGELVEPVDVVRRYIGRMDGALDFHIADAIRRTFGDRARSSPALDQFLEAHLDYFDPNFLMLTFIDNHDMDRFLFLAGGDRSRLRQAVDVQMRLPGPPVIYYGSEVGVGRQPGKASEVGLEVSRLEMVWGDEQDAGLLEFYREAIQSRRAARSWEATLRAAAGPI